MVALYDGPVQNYFSHRRIQITHYTITVDNIHIMSFRANYTEPTAYRKTQSGLQHLIHRIHFTERQQRQLVIQCCSFYTCLHLVKHVLLDFSHLLIY